MSGRLLGNLLLFGRVLRGLGLEAGPGRLIDLARALEHVPIGHKSDFYHAARSLLVRRREEIPLFDKAFEAFWRKPSRGWTSLDLRAMGERRRFRRPGLVPPPLDDDRRQTERWKAETESSETPTVAVTRTYSAEEVLRHKDFSDLTGEEIEAVRSLIGRLVWRLGLRRTRRRRPGGGSVIDLRRSVRQSLRHGGEVLEWARRERTQKPRPLVVLADISGSMERYTRLLLLFLYALAEGLHCSLEVFVFGTRLTRITKELSGRDIEQAFSGASRAVPDWSGGTRIGESFKAFNFLWSRRVLSRGAIAAVISDGWDRGDPQLLARETARLQRSCHRLIWLNPLLGSPRYEPLTRGIRAALPYVDDFLPVHNLASLEQLARHLEELPPTRPARRQPGSADISKVI